MIAAVLGIVVGLVLGLTGAGGSIFAVPLLMVGLGWTLTQAAPVALLAVAASAAFGTWAAWDKAYVRYRAALLMGAVGIVAAPLGLRAGAMLPNALLTQVFAVVMLLVAVRLFRQARRAPGEAAIVRAAVTGDGSRSEGPICRLNAQTGRILWTRPCAAVIAAIGAVTGFIAGLLGVGGGFVIVPALRGATELSIHSAVATSLMTIALTAGGAAAWGFGASVAAPVGVSALFVGGSLLGMLAGRRAAPRVAGARLQQGFALVMGTCGIALLGHASGWPVP